MESEDLIVVEVFCTICEVERTLMDEFEEFGLVEIIQNNGLKYIHINQLPQVQKIIKFHNELNINKEGIEVVLNLLDRLNEKNAKIKYLQDKLKLYEQ